jgi:hypothetical protein
MRWRRLQLISGGRIREFGNLRIPEFKFEKGLTGLSQILIKPLPGHYVIYTTTKIFMLVVLRVKKSSSMSMEEFLF